VSDGLVTRKAAVGMMRAGALAAALYLAGGAIPFVGALAMLFAPAPILGYAAGRSWPVWRAAGAVAIATVLAGAGAGLLAAASYVTSLGLAAVLMCWMLERKLRFEAIVLAVSMVVVLAGAASALAVAGSLGALVSDARQALQAALAHSDEIYRTMGVQSSSNPEARSRMLDLMVRLSPALAMLTVVFAVLANLMLFWRWVGKKRLDYPLFGDLARWCSPEWLIWPFLAAGFALFVPHPPVRTVAIDSFICVAAVYFCQGLAIVAFYFRVLSMPILVRSAIYMIAVIQPLIAGLLCAVGIFDMWVDFRRLKPRRPDATRLGDLF
jgi:uncharacterized protein YybS (DUF2232 family)